MTKEEYAQDLINNNTPEEEFITLMDTWDVDNSIMEDPSISDIEGDGEGDEEDEKKKKKWWKRDKKKKEDTELGKVEQCCSDRGCNTGCKSSGNRFGVVIGNFFIGCKW